MQDLTTPPPMSSPYTPAGGGNMSPASQPGAPVLGPQVPGTTGGLPQKPGLSVATNPMASELQSSPQQSAMQTQSYGRGDDSMLVHMTPEEVNSLRGLAQKFGGDLTTNPHTGLPEAGWLGKLLPTILGGLGMAFGIPPVWMGALGAVGGTAITGDLKQGLMAGLGAFGGASMAGGLGLGAKLGHVGADIGLSGSVARAVPQMVAPQAASAGALGTETLGTQVGNLGQQAAGILKAVPGMPGMSASSIAGLAGPQTSAGLIGGFKNAATAGIPSALKSIAVPAAVMGLANALPTSSGGTKDQQTGAIDNSYQGPYYAQKREFIPTSTADLLSSSKERQHVTNIMPEVYNSQGQLVSAGTSTAPGTPIVKSTFNPNAKKGENQYTFSTQNYMGVQPTAQQDQQQALLAQLYPEIYGGGSFAHGGEVHMREGSFVMPARETAEFGKGSTNAGQRALARIGGIPIHGQGDGTSDDIKANIDGQPARVADGEVHFPPEAVRRIGGGDPKRGTAKLYAMMKQAEKSRKRAARGGDGLNVAKGLGAL